MSYNRGARGLARRLVGRLVVKKLFLFPLGLVLLSPALAAEKGAKKPPAAAAADKPRETKTPKSKTYTFTGLDVEGKLKTPQLLYFLNRVKLELDTTSPEKRSFMKELVQSGNDQGL